MSNWTSSVYMPEKFLDHSRLQWMGNMNMFNKLEESELMIAPGFGIDSSKPDMRSLTMICMGTVSESVPT